MTPLKFEAYIEIEKTQQTYFGGAVTRFCFFIFYCLIFSSSDRNDYVQCLSFNRYYDDTVIKTYKVKILMILHTRTKLKKSLISVEAIMF